jgi:hypothetical protein
MPPRNHVREKEQTMKKVVIPVLIFFGLLLGAVIFFVGVRYSQVQYEKDTQGHFVAIAQDENGQMTAKSGGVTVLVSPDNWGRGQWLFTITERKRLASKPDVSLDDGIVFTLSDGAVYTVVADTSAEDAAYICYTFEGRDKWFRIEGYKVMDWATRLASPEGIYAPNEVIEP